jgi:type IV secretory pathway ATPase VirB11/archaellum biosynthesis ATPase
MARSAEKLAAVGTALKQMRERKHNRVTLWCGKPRYWIKGSFQIVGTHLQTLLGKPPTIFLPDAQRSLLVIGTPGSGKTASVIDSALESAFTQGFPVILYDKKGGVDSLARNQS